ncbi:perlucin-like protein [Pecten maximus]|uniref:perlucin-like protein n=1 Tax=Pecten maximus TaxID=6579 RepID=UPI001458158F|nr:perlucin-like protein [Pecten maximus]
MDKLHILVFAVTLIIPYSGAAQCRAGWYGFLDSCYYLSHGLATWVEANDVCKMLGGFLARIESADELTYLKSELGHIHRHDADQQLYWIAGNDFEVDNVWRWMNNGEKVSFLDWAPGEPNAAEDANCLDLWGAHEFRYADNNCEEHHNYVCQIKDTEGNQLIG